MILLAQENIKIISRKNGNRNFRFCPPNHGKPQATSRRDFREQKQLFAKAKTILFAFAPDMPKGIRGKSEFARIKV